jgi:hypothetical protein
MEHGMRKVDVFDSRGSPTLRRPLPASEPQAWRQSRAAIARPGDEPRGEKDQNSVVPIEEVHRGGAG